MLSRQVWVLCLAALGARAQEETGTGTGVSTTATQTDSSSSSSSRSSSSRSAEYTAFEFTNSDLSTISTTIPVTDFKGSKFTYVTDSGQRTVTSTGPRIFVSGDRTLTLNSENGTASATSNSQITRTTNTNELTQISGNSNRTMTATGTSSAPPVMNTAACNNHPEFCNRKYSNITEVAAHNAAFAVKNNAGSNQEYSITAQLNDGIRMREFDRPRNGQCDKLLTKHAQSKAKSTTSTKPSTTATPPATCSTPEPSNPSSKQSSPGYATTPSK